MSHSKMKLRQYLEKQKELEDEAVTNKPKLEFILVLIHVFIFLN